MSALALVLMLDRLRKYASKRKVPAALAMRHPAVRHPLKTRARDLRRVSRSNLTKAGLSSVRSKKRMCEHCRSLVSKALYDWHVQKR